MKDAATVESLKLHGSSDAFEFDRFSLVEFHFRSLRKDILFKTAHYLDAANIGYALFSKSCDGL